MIVFPSAAMYVSNKDMQNLTPSHQRKFFDIAGVVCLWRIERAHTRF
jgi:hypothetical protein